MIKLFFLNSLTICNFYYSFCLINISQWVMNLENASIKPNKLQALNWIFWISSPDLLTKSICRPTTPAVILFFFFFFHDFEFREWNFNWFSENTKRGRCDRIHFCRLYESILYSRLNFLKSSFFKGSTFIKWKKVFPLKKKGFKSSIFFSAQLDVNP